MLQKGTCVRAWIIALFMSTVILGGAVRWSSAATTTTDEQQVIQLTIAGVQARFPGGSTQPTVIQLAIIDNYALTTWALGEGGGNALLQKNKKGVWSVIALHGGGMGPPILEAFGVPASTATSLWNGLAPVPTPTP